MRRAERKTAFERQTRGARALKCRERAFVRHETHAGGGAQAVRVTLPLEDLARGELRRRGRAVASDGETERREVLRVEGQGDRGVVDAPRLHGGERRRRGREKSEGDQSTGHDETALAHHRSPGFEEVS